MAKTPTGVKILSVLYYLGAAVMAIFGIMALLKKDTASFILNVDISGILTLAGVIFIGLAVLYFFIARDLWNLKKWAWWIVLVLSSIGAIIGLFTIFGGSPAQGIFNIALAGLIIWYLTKPDIKKLFK
tara:strand:+ start:889 stop:1272 length:384 start_codon:yes stop_codon:yes gene_type:complete